jgi:SnoaL-like protein
VKDAFRQAAEAKDPEAMAASLAPDVVFRSPIVFRQYEGREAVMGLLSLVVEVFEDFRYVDQLDGDESRCLLFRARVGDREIDGIDHLRFDSGGLVQELTVMVRPLSGAHALAQAMEAKLEARLTAG